MLGEALHAGAVRAPCVCTLLAAPMPDTSALRERSRCTGRPGHHCSCQALFHRKQCPLYLLLPSTGGHSTQGAMLRAETSSPDNKPMCPDLVIVWNGEADTPTPGKHPAFCDCGTNGPRWAGKPTSSQCALCPWHVCMQAHMHVHMYTHIRSSFL